jgi:hypothetical protein
MANKEPLTREEILKRLDEIKQKEIVLLQNIKRELPNLEKLLEQSNSRWAEEDKVYRFYHESNKVYYVQGLTQVIYDALERISPHQEGEKIPDPYYKQIISEGMTGREHKNEDNKNWAGICRPMLEAFFHSKYFLEMAVKYGRVYQELPQQKIKSGWAALLELYGLMNPARNYVLLLMMLEEQEKAVSKDKKDENQKNDATTP